MHTNVSDKFCARHARLVAPTIKTRKTDGRLFYGAVIVALIASGIAGYLLASLMMVGG